MPLQATSGTASYDAFGGGAAAVPQYIEDVFSTYLYTGNQTARSITNGIDLSTKGGLVWIKDRNNAIRHAVFDSARGSVSYLLIPNSTAAQNVDFTNNVTSFNADGFSLGTGSNENGTGRNYVSWTFAKQPKFFDIVTYTGNAANRTIAHNLGSVPGCIIVKRTDDTSFWAVYHKDLGVDQGYVGKDFHIFLNSTNAQDGISAYWNQTAPTSTVFSIGASSQVNTNGGTYVAYVFAHNAGGFGLTGTDNVISCGTFTCDGSGNATVDLGYEPQWLLRKASNEITNWELFDNMRGLSVTDNATRLLYANLSNGEENTSKTKPTATGFIAKGEISKTYIYIAIRRGPMKVPTDGTKVFAPIAYTGTGFSMNNVTGASFAPDMYWPKNRANAVSVGLYDKLRGTRQYLLTSSAGAEETDTSGDDGLGYQLESFNQNGVSVNRNNSLTNENGATFIGYMFKRAPSFFDEVCDSGTGGAKTITHNLGVAPELWIRKRRDSATYGNWYTYTSALGNTKYLILETTAAQATATADVWNLTTPTATTLSVGGDLNLSGGGAAKYVNYLFATCAGVSKVGSYTGNGTTQTIDCGFGAGGARFVLIKRTDSTGAWYVYDTARGMTVLTDPYLLLNSTAAEAATLGSVTTVSTGFALNSTILAAINVSAGSYIFLAIA